MIFRINLFLIYILYILIHSLCTEAQSTTTAFTTTGVENACSLSKDLLSELKNPYLSFDGWFHVSKRYIIPFNSLFINFTYTGANTYSSPCPTIDPLCPYNFWTFSSN